MTAASSIVASKRRSLEYQTSITVLRASNYELRATNYDMGERMTKIRNFEDLDVWKVSHQLVLDVYHLTKGFSKQELFGLTAQMRRASTSVPANIAEGFGRRNLKEKANFYNIAQGSISELRYYFILARDMGYVSNIEKQLDCCDHIARMLHRMMEKMRNARA